MSAIDIMRHYPLDPLDAEEVRVAASLVKADPRLAGVGLPRFVSIEPEEPDKAEPESSAQRRVLVVLLDRSAGTTIEIVVSLTAARVERWAVVPGAQGAIMVSEIEEAEQAVREDPGFLAALRRRGISDVRDVQIDPWPAGNFGFEHEQGRRLARAIAFRRDHLYDNGYAHPIEGIIALVDLNRMVVIDVEDHEVVPIPPMPGNFDPGAVGAMRDDIKPLEITQPEGPSFTVDGHQVTWQKWRFRVGFNAREGLVLHQVGYEDGGRVRPILHRASISEMTVPYGDPSPTHFLKSVFDAGENGIGIAATSSPAAATASARSSTSTRSSATATVSRSASRTRSACTRRTTACSGSTPTGGTARREVRRSRRLVVSSFSTIGNYDYGFFWYLYQDGTIELEVKLSGVLSTGAVGAWRAARARRADRASAQRAGPSALLQRQAGLRRRWPNQCG